MLGLPPSGRSVTMIGIDFGHWQDGKLVEIWHSEDQLAKLQHLGAIPGPG